MRSSFLRKLVTVALVLSAAQIGAAPTQPEGGGTGLSNPFTVAALPSAATARGPAWVTNGSTTGGSDPCATAGGTVFAMCCPNAARNGWEQCNPDANTLDGKDSTDFLLRDGTLAMTGSLAMGGNTVFGNSTASGNMALISTSNNTRGYIYLGSGNDVAINDATGEVGIGDATPDARLDVEGAAIITGLLTVSASGST